MYNNIAHLIGVRFTSHKGDALRVMGTNWNIKKQKCFGEVGEGSFLNVVYFLTQHGIDKCLDGQSGREHVSALGLGINLCLCFKFNKCLPLASRHDKIHPLTYQKLRELVFSIHPARYIRVINALLSFVSFHTDALFRIQGIPK